MSWHDRAACRDADPEQFFPPFGVNATEAKEVCGICDVRDECLQYALHEGIVYGVWGGMSERERMALRRRMGLTRIQGPAVCGTAAGAQRHRRNGEPACEECREAYNVDQRERRAS